MLGTAILLGLALTVEPAKAEVTLGEPVELKVTVKNDGKEPATGPEVVLDGRSVTLTIGETAEQFVYTRTNVDQQPNGFTSPKVLATKTIAPGESVSGAVSYTPVRAGELAIEAAYAGKASGSTRVTVKPSADGATELGALIVTTQGPMRIRFFPKVAPNHVAHFAERVRTGFYDGTPFHRIIQGFMAQGGDPLGQGTGGPGYQIPAEFSKDPEYAHTFGRLSTARTRDPNSAGSQFFVCFDGARMLDGQYTVFGEVFDGLEAVKKLEALGLGRDDPRNGMLPKEKHPRIEKATLAPMKSGS